MNNITYNDYKKKYVGIKCYYLLFYKYKLCCYIISMVYNKKRYK